MSKQQSQPQGAHRESPEKNGDPTKSHDRLDRMKNPADQAYQENEPSEDEGGEESRHGRKQKGNVVDR